MEEPESEWEIKEYSSSKEDDIDDDDITSLVKWILDNGYVIGKHIVITGVVISLAPIVVPPLVVFSVMGFTFLVPFGFGFATYACTNKIMSVLLPIPRSPSPTPIILEYEQGDKCRFELDDSGDDYRQIDGVDDGSYIDEYDNVGRGGEVEDLVTNVDADGDEEGYYVGEEEIEEDEFGLENVVVEEEDNEQMEDSNQGVNIVTELDEGGDDYGKQGEASLTMNVDENIDEESHRANENVDEKEMDDLVVQRENVDIEEEEKEKMEDIMQGVDIVSELDEGGDAYWKQGEASIGNVDEDVNEESDYAIENVDEKEIEDYMVQRENVLNEEKEKDQMEDIKQGVDIVSEFNEGGDDYGRHGEASIVNLGDDVNEESNYANENVDEKELEDHVVQRENALVEEEEKEQMEDIKQGVEMRIGLDVVGEDQGYEEDMGEYLEGDDDSFEDERKEEKPIIESQIDENTRKSWEATEDEMDEKVGGSTGLLEYIRHEGNDNATVEDDYLLDEGALVFEDARDVERTEPVVVRQVESEKLIKDGKENDETIGEVRHIVILAEGNEENNFNVREVEELDLVAREVKGDTNKNARNAESEEKVMRESMGTQEETCGYTSNDGSEDSVLETKKEHLIHSYADVREIGDESGLDLFDERNTNIHFATLEADDEEKENIADENIDFVALPAFKRKPLAMDNGKAPSKTKTNTKMPSREDILDEERIWEKIGAMRTILGYKAPIQAACIGELKDLYVFTGVEPPTSFKDDSDLDEVNAKLKFLMSIVGVK